MTVLTASMTPSTVMKTQSQGELPMKHLLISAFIVLLVACGGSDGGNIQPEQDGDQSDGSSGSDVVASSGGEDIGTTDDGFGTSDGEDVGTTDEGSDSGDGGDVGTTDEDVGSTTDEDVGSTTDEDVGSTTDEDAGSTADEDVGSTTDEDVIEEEPLPDPIPEGTWHAVGGSVNDSLSGSLSPEFVDLAYDTDENPVIAFTERSVVAGPQKCEEKSAHLFVMRYTANGWTHADGVTPGVENVSAGTDGEFEPRYASNPSVAVMPDGGLVLGWTSATTCLAGKQGATVMARIYNPNKGWSDLGEGSTSDFGITNTNLNHASRIRIDPLGRPVVIYVTANTVPGQFGGFLHVRRYEDLKWSGVGGAGQGQGLSEGLLAADIINEFMDLDFNTDAELVVIWSTLDLASLVGFVLYKEHKNGEWVDVDGSGQDPGVSPDYQLVLPNPAVAVTPFGRTHLVWTKTFTGTTGYDMPLYHASVLPGEK
jgi:hypothetical protein